MAMFLIRGYGLTQRTQSKLRVTVQLDVLNIISNCYTLGKQKKYEWTRVTAVKSIVFLSRSTRETLDTVLFIIQIPCYRNVSSRVFEMFDRFVSS